MSRRIRLYIASSLDGYIARSDGSIDWLDKMQDGDEDYGYGAFLQTVDTTLMGHNTYDFILKLGEEFPYPDKTNYVFTRQQRETKPYVQFVTQDPGEFVAGLRQMPGGDIWLVGGGQLNGALLRAGAVDEIILSLVPVVLGAGIPLFAGSEYESWYELQDSRAYANGLVQLVYGKK